MSYDLFPHYEGSAAPSALSDEQLKQLILEREEREKQRQLEVEIKQGAESDAIDRRISQLDAEDAARAAGLSRRRDEAESSQKLLNYWIRHEMELNPSIGQSIALLRRKRSLYTFLGSSMGILVGALLCFALYSWLEFNFSPRPQSLLLTALLPTLLCIFALYRRERVAEEISMQFFALHRRAYEKVAVGMSQDRDPVSPPLLRPSRLTDPSRFPD